MEQLLLTQAVSYIVTVVCGAVVGVVVAKARQIKGVFDSQQANTLMLCRLCIYDEHFSVDEKIEAYRTYRANGGNSQTKHYMDELLGQDADAYLAVH